MNLGCVAKGFGRVAGVAVALFIASLLLDWFGAFDFLFRGVMRESYALISPHAPAGELPRLVSITFDGAHASFQRGNSDYERFIDLLRVRRPETTDENARPYPLFRLRQHCGELTIPHYGIPFHFQIFRADTDPTHLWIGLFHISGLPGITYPSLYDDGRLGPFVKSKGEPAKTRTVTPAHPIP